MSDCNLALPRKRSTGCLALAASLFIAPQALVAEAFDYAEFRLSQYAWSAYDYIFDVERRYRPLHTYGAFETSQNNLELGFAIQTLNSRTTSPIDMSVMQLSIGFKATEHLRLYTLLGQTQSNIVFGTNYRGIGAEWRGERLSFGAEYINAPSYVDLRNLSVLYQITPQTAIYTLHSDNGYQNYFTSGVHHESGALTFDLYAHYYPGYFEYGTSGLSMRYRTQTPFFDGDIELFGNVVGLTEDAWRDGVATLGIGLPFKGSFGAEITVSSNYSISEPIPIYGVHLVYRKGKKRQRLNDQITDYLRGARPPWSTYYDTTPFSRGFHGYVGWLPIP